MVFQEAMHNQRLLAFGLSALVLLSSSESLVAREAHAALAGAAESCRLTFPLGTPRRYATRFDAGKRLLEVRVLPARSQEFDASSFYDTRCIHRLVVHEFPGEVVLGLQLRNTSLGWLVTHQEEPWRLVVDLWPTEGSKALAQEWSWQGGTAPNLVAETVAEAVAEATPEAAPPVVALDLPQLQPTPVQEIAATNPILPEGFGRILTPRAGAKPEELAARAEGGGAEEFDRKLDHAYALHEANRHGEAVELMRRLASLWETRFQAIPKALWAAGESAFLAGKRELARDYLRSLRRHHADSEFAWLARVRLLDADVLDAWKGENPPRLSPEQETDYAEIAASEKAPWSARASATVKILQGVVDENPQAARLYQQNVDNCANNAQVAVELRRVCSYIGTRFSIENMDAVSADAAVKKFEQSFPGDAKAARLREKVTGMAQEFLEQCRRDVNWQAWVAFEESARAELLAPLDSNSAGTLFRAEAYATSGKPAKAVKLYSAYLPKAKDAKARFEAQAVAATLAYKMGDKRKAAEFVRLIANDNERNQGNLTERAIASLRDIALAPHRNRDALNILMDEIEAGRYVERKLEALVEYSRLLKGRPMAERLFEKILSFPVRTSGEVRLVENVLLQYAQELSDTARLAKSGDIFMAVANITNGTRRAESAYKAGIVYARAGLLEKARASWQQAASDLSDVRYSTLANERLERIR